MESFKRDCENLSPAFIRHDIILICVLAISIAFHMWKKKKRKRKDPYALHRFSFTCIRTGSLLVDKRVNNCDTAENSSCSLAALFFIIRFFDIWTCLLSEELSADCSRSTLRLLFLALHTNMHTLSVLLAWMQQLQFHCAFFFFFLMHLYLYLSNPLGVFTVVWLVCTRVPFTPVPPIYIFAWCCILLSTRSLLQRCNSSITMLDKRDFGSPGIKWHISLQLPSTPSWLLQSKVNIIHHLLAFIPSSPL